MLNPFKPSPHHTTIQLKSGLQSYSNDARLRRTSFRSAQQSSTKLICSVPSVSRTCRTDAAGRVRVLRHQSWQQSHRTPLVSGPAARHMYMILHSKGRPEI
jgi:hypothetical protein